MMTLRRPTALSRTPQVEVVVPCYNYGRFLPECVGSVLSQPGVQVRVTVVDDCSTDDSGAVADRLAASDRRIRVIHHETNRGHIATYNDGLKQADSDYVVLISADDVLATGALARAATLFEARPEIGLVYGGLRNFSGQVPAPSGARVSWSTWHGDAWVRAQFRRGLNAIYSPEAVVRTSVQHQVGYYDPSLPHSGDLEMWLRVAGVCDVGHVNGPVHAYRRIHPAAMSQNAYTAVLDDLRERVRAYRTYLDRHPDEQERRVLERIMVRRAVEEAFGWAAERARRGELSAGTADAVREFGLELDPAVEHRAAWSVLDGAAASLPAGRRLRAAAWSARVDLADRLRWRRWHWWGM